MRVETETDWLHVFLLGMLCLMCGLAAIGMVSLGHRLEDVESRVHAIDGR